MRSTDIDIRPAWQADLEAINRVIEAAVMTWHLPDRVKRLSLPCYRYDNVDLDHLDIVLAEDGRQNIIGIAAWEQADALQSCVGKHLKYVFTYKGNPLKWVDNTTWKRACKKAGIDDFRWHDMRHTWANWHVQAGTPLTTLMELGGWATYEMVLRYAHIASGQLSSASANINQTPVETDSDKADQVTNQLCCNVIQLHVKSRCNS